AGADIIGINNRDLDTLRVDISLSEKLAPRIKEMGARFVIAESGIENREQVRRLENLGVDAFLVGTSLMKSKDPVKKLRELMGYNF
ncbi:MAG: indole-3-glycerol-phosphate synthase TrpC, partial [Aquificaceae bacterium]